jgi:gliding motility-associated-like protein
MNKNTLFNILKERKSDSRVNRPYVLFFSLVVTVVVVQNGNAQTVNKGTLKVGANTDLAVYMDYENQASGNFINDGHVYVFQNWRNDGIVTYSNSGSGTTFFAGTQQQLIEGSKQSDFQNVVFNNLSSLVPFNLTTVISVGKNSDFQNGIINAFYDQTNPFYAKSKMIFLENANHTSTGDQSFVDGRVEKKGNEAFQFPVGNELFFRPSEQGASSSLSNVYTTQYYYQNSDVLYPHNSKEESIVTINSKEYWNITQDEGSENIVLSLTLDHDTTPSDFFTQNEDTELAIVRWNGTKWVNEKGVLSETITGEPYSNLLTGTVSGYGIFTMALVKKTPPEPPTDLIVYNAVSPNDDGINDTFHIKGIDNYPDNTVEIYNRWGVKVFDAKSYNESDNVFRGYSDGRVTVNRGEKLPTGTYFYILKYNKNGKGEQKTGYLYINNQ